MEPHALYQLLQLDGASLGDGSLVFSLHPDGSRLAAARGPILCIGPVLPTSSSQTHVFGQDAPEADPAGDEQNDQVEQALRNRRATHGSAGPRNEARPSKASPRFACPAASGPPTVSQDDITALAWLAFARPPSAPPSAEPDGAAGRGGVGVGGRDSASSAVGGGAGGAQGWRNRSGSGRRRTNSSGGGGGLFASIQVMMEDQELLQQEQQQRLIAAAATPAQPPSKYSLVVLLSGTREGALQLHHADTGAVLLRQQLHSGPVVSIAVRTWRMGLNPSDAVEDVTVGWADAVVRLAAWELRAAATTCYAAYAAAAAVRARGVAGAPGGGQSRFTLWGSSPAAAPTGPEVRPLAVQKWEMPSGAARGRSCVVCCGQRPRDLYSLLQGIGSSSIATGKTIFLAAGKPPSCLAALEVDEQSSGGGGALSYISSVATSVWGLARTARSVAAAPLFLRDGLKSFVLNPLQLAGIGGGSGGVAPSAPAPLASFPDAAAGQRPPVTGVWRQHRDDGRAVLSLAPAPYGSLVAAVDNLGRVFLVELGTMLVSRMWKGYRDAQIAWIEVHERNVARLLGRQRSEDRCDRKPAQQQEQVTEQQQQQQSLQQGRKQLQQKPQHTSQLQEEPPQASASGPSLRGCDGGHNDNACQQVAIGPGAGCRDADRSGYKGSHVQDLDRMAPNKGERDRRPNYRETVNPGSHAAQSSSMFSLPQEMAGQPKAAPGQGDAQKHVCEAAGGHGGRSNAGEYMLLLAVYAPRRQTLELWFPLQGERLAAIASPPKARLLQRGGGGAGGASGELGTWRVADAASAASPPMTPTGCMMCFVGTAPNLGSGFELEQAASVGRDGLQLLDVETVFGLT